MGRFGAYILRAKHWQVFLLFFVPLCLLLAAPVGRGPSIAFAAVAGIVELCFLGWLGSLGAFLSSVVEPPLRLNTNFFRFALIYPPLYMGAALFALSEWFFPTLFLIIIPLHLFAMFCVPYTFYFVSKSLVLAETGRSATFHSYIDLFFLIWFFPIGVWVVQPRVNRLYAERRRPAL